MDRRTIRRTPATEVGGSSYRRQPSTGVEAAQETAAAETADALEGVDFASDEAAEAASAAGLSAADFEGLEPSGQHGYTVADVRGLASRD